MLANRLLPLLLALTVAVPAATRGPCCCLESKGDCCEEKAAAAESAPRPCCQTRKDLPPCCRKAAGENEGCSATSVGPGPCGCQRCPAAKPVSPLAPAPRSAAPTDDRPAAADAVAPTTPLALVPGPTPARAAEWLSHNRPPPDRQALLCVWTI